ncbi:hypothetical protein V9T40_005723 [Parthenolecanium corni]|uniref:Uncharacterized protein n=1 Tax=Parthenolecanium corni TaxID=536013 RepID=A0AAN9TTD4_9HEMI
MRVKDVAMSLAAEQVDSGEKRNFPCGNTESVTASKRYISSTRTNYLHCSSSIPTYTSHICKEPSHTREPCRADTQHRNKGSRLAGLYLRPPNTKFNGTRRMRRRRHRKRGTSKQRYCRNLLNLCERMSGDQPCAERAAEQTEMENQTNTSSRKQVAKPRTRMSIRHHRRVVLVRSSQADPDVR